MKIKQIQLNQVFKNATFSMLGHTSISSLLIFILYGNVPSIILFIWTVTMSSSLLFRLFIVYRYNSTKQNLNPDCNIRKWFVLYQIGVFCTGLSWGLSVFFTDYYQPIDYRLLVTALGFGLSAGSVATLGAMFSIYLAFTVPMMSIIVAAMFFSDGQAHFETGIMISIGVVFIVSSAYRYSKNYYEVLLKNKEIETQNKILAYKANYDILTDIPNRELLLDRLSQSIKSAQRESKLTAVLYIDIDRFKKINDSLGHQVGDEVLKAVSSQLKKGIRKTDTLARIGGDEFAMILSCLNDINHIIDIVGNMIDVMNKPIQINEHQLYATISVGISIYPDDGSSTDILLKNADTAMYKAKDDGRNTYCFYTKEMTEKAIARIIMENKLREAIKKEEFIVYYQPQVDGKNDKLVGMEALIRWKNTDKEIISPAEFIPLAEETGLIIELDQWTMQAAMKQMVIWYSKDLNPGRLSLNLSVKLLQEKNFINLLGRMIDNTGCKPSWIELEITESQIMTNPDNAIFILKQINEMGIGLAIDDFGTGYSSLSYLKRLPIDKLKIDQSFVKDLPYIEEDIGISKAIIALAKSLSLSVIAEGVETVEQKDFLVKHGCRNIQGYYYSRPIPAIEMEGYLNNEK